MSSGLLMGKYAEYLPICYKGIGLTTKEGYSVAMHHPLKGPHSSMNGVVLTYPNRQAVETACMTALQSRHLTAGTEYLLRVELFHSSALAVQTLLERGINRP